MENEHDMEVARLPGEYMLKYTRMMELARNAPDRQTHLEIVGMMEELIALTHRLHALLSVERAGRLLLQIIEQERRKDGERPR